MQSQTRDAESAPLPTRIGPFLIASEVARGQLATVYVGYADDAEDAPPRAIKRVRRELSSVTGWGELLADEAQLLARIDHPNVVGVEGVGEDNGVYVALEYVEGESLERLLRLPGVPRSPAMVCSILADALRGLAHAHAAVDHDGAPLGLVHQAPRARHILVGVDGRARVADFTQAHARSLAPNSLRRQRLRAGSMAPEHTLAPKHVDFRADLFILGMTLWEALTERPLFETKLTAASASGATTARYPNPSTIGAKPPACFDDVCMRALQRDPERRFGSAAEMLAALLAAAKQIGGPAPAPDVARWVKAAVERRPPLSRPPFPPEASGSYRKPALPRADEEEHSRELPLAAVPAKVGEELAAQPAAPAERADQSAHGEATQTAAKVAAKVEPVVAVPPLDPAPRTQAVAQIAERKVVSTAAAAPARPDPVYARARTIEAPATPTRTKAATLERLSLALVTAALVSATVVAGDLLIRRLLPSPEPAQLDAATLAALPAAPLPRAPAADTPNVPTAPASAGQAALEQVAPEAARPTADAPPGEAPPARVSAPARVPPTARSKAVSAESATAEQSVLPDNPY